MNSFSILFAILNPLFAIRFFMLWGGGGKGGGGGGDQRDYAAEQRARVASGQAKVNEAFTPFDDAFYDTRKQAYLDYYKPEYDKQSMESEQQLVKALASRGQLGSSMEAKERANLESERLKVWGDILSGAENYDLGNRSSIAGVKSNLLAMAGDTDDATLSRMAGEQAAAQSRAPAFSSIGQLFANLTTPAALGLARGGGSPVVTTAGATNPYSPGNPVIAGTPNVGGRKSTAARVIG